MHRPLLLSALLAALSPLAVAQTTEPDSVDWHRYAPLRVGNVWQYAVDTQIDAPIIIYDRSYFDVRITGQTTIDGETYYEVATCGRHESAPPACDGPATTSFVRYDEATASLAAPAGQPLQAPWVWYPCGLNAAFHTNGPVPREAPCADGGVDFQYFVTGEYSTTYNLIGRELTGSLTRKAYSTMASSDEVLTDVGLMGTYAGDPWCGFCVSLAYTRINGVAYGSPMITVANEAAPEAGASALVVAPNPVRGAATLRYALDAPQRVVAEAYDVAGRLVRRVELGAQAAGPQDVRLGVEGLPPGAYLLRLHGDAGFTASRGVIVAR